MLFAFHQLQNASSPGSVSATYFLSGTRAADQLNGGTTTTGGRASESEGRSHPLRSFLSWMSDPPDADPCTSTRDMPCHTALLVPERELRAARAEFAAVDAAFVYSVQAGGAGLLD
ncbi:hypothetical protein KEM52_005196, partial [Ascosphaera acerosa]